MSEGKSLTLEIHVKYEVKPVEEFLNKGERSITGRRLVEEHPELVSETAERDSKLAQEQGIPEGTNWVLFIGKDRIWCVYRFGDGLDRAPVRGRFAKRGRR